jgi:hypothetical protein
MALAWGKTATSVPTDYLGDASNSHTYSGVAIGTASADRYVVVKIVYGGEREIVSLTVGGVAASLVIVSGTSTVIKTAIYIAAVPTGTTADIVVTMDYNVATLGICVGALTGANATATATYALEQGYNDPIAMALTIPAGGIMLFSVETEVANTPTLDKGVFDYQSEGAEREQDSGYYGTAGAQTVTVSSTGMSCAVAAAFGPAAVGSASVSPSIAPKDGIAWGEQNPGASEEAVTWKRWQTSPGVQVVVSGDPDWGACEVASGTPCYGEVIDTGDTNSKTFTVARDKYASGSGAVTISIRGSASVFTQHAGSPSWSTYTTPTSQTWRYVQVKVEA